MIIPVFIILTCTACFRRKHNYNLKGHAQAKIIKKSVILFWLLNMTIWCKHVHRLELQFLDIETKFLISNYWQPCQYGNFVSLSSLTGECAAEKLKNFCSSSLLTCSHHMVILRSQNEINDFFMLSAWACPFNTNCYITQPTVAYISQFNPFSAGTIIRRHNLKFMKSHRKNWICIISP